LQDKGELFHVVAVVDPPKPALGFKQRIGQPFRGHLRFGFPSTYPAGFGPDIPERVLDAVGVEQRRIQRAGRAEAVDGQQLVSCFFQTRKCLGILPFQECPQLLHNLFRGLQAFRLAKAVEEPVHFAVVAIGKIALEVAGLVDQAALNDGVRPFPAHGFAQGLRSVRYGEQAPLRLEAARFEPIEQIHADLKVFGSAELEVEDVLLAFDRDAQRHDRAQVAPEHNAVEHEHDIVRLAQIPCAQLLDAALAFLLPQAADFAVARAGCALEHALVLARGHPGHKSPEHGVAQRTAVLGGFIGLEAHLLAVLAHARPADGFFVGAEEIASWSRTGPLVVAVGSRVVGFSAEGFDLLEKRCGEGRSGSHSKKRFNRLATLASCG
jgi:hypothetical protein